jgi:hypothetical protein
MVCGVGFALGTMGIAFCGVILIKFLAWGEYKFFGGKNAKKKAVTGSSKDWKNGDTGGVLPPER